MYGCRDREENAAGIASPRTPPCRQPRRDGARAAARRSGDLHAQETRPLRLTPRRWRSATSGRACARSSTTTSPTSTRKVPTIGWLLFGYSIVMAAVVVTAAHFFASWGLDKGRTNQTVVLMLISSIALALIAVLIWAHWETRNDAENMFSYLVAIIASAVTIGVATQAFAALNVYLSLRGLVSSEATPSFWRAEISYFWHSSTPFLSSTSPRLCGGMNRPPSATTRAESSCSCSSLRSSFPRSASGLPCYRALEEERRRTAAPHQRRLRPVRSRRADLARPGRCREYLCAAGRGRAHPLLRLAGALRVDLAD